MNKKELEVIETVQGMLNESSFISKDELLVATKEMGWKPLTLNFALSRLKKAGAIEENNNKEFILIKEFNEGDIMIEERKVNNNSYRTKKTNYRREIPQLSDEQQSIKDLILDNKSLLNGKVIKWTDENGMEFPLEIAGGGDITLRCRFYLSKFMSTESETGALVYIPWHEPMMANIKEQIENHLSQGDKSHLCVNFGVAPAK